MEKAGYNRPQQRRMRRRFIALGLVLVSALMLISDRQQKSMLVSGRLSADDTSARIMGFIATPVRGIEALFVKADERANVQGRNVYLTAEVERLRPFEHHVYDLEIRIKNLEAILNIDSSSDIPMQKIVARSVNETNGPFAHSALINVGANKGVAKGHAVMTVDGLYGHIVRVGRNSARVLLLNDLNSRISVMSVRSQSRAILVGNNNDVPRLEYISPDADWNIGDVIVSSGDGGVLPRGLPIGIVVTTKKQKLAVELYTEGRPIDWVWVYPFEPIKTPEDEPVLGVSPDEAKPAIEDTPLTDEQTPTQDEQSGEQAAQ